jgi:hypothetical protein
MQSLTEKMYHLAPPGGLFDDSVVRNAFPALSAGARKQLIHRAVDHGEVLRLKPGLYVLAPDYRRSSLHPFVVAAALHSPSHVSLESALSYHGLIPEAVFQVSSVTVERGRCFKTPLGNFEFYRVPSDQPRAGVVAERLDDHSWAFVASPLRAIADLVYLRKTVTSQDALKFLTDSMRIDEDDLHAVDLEDLEAIRGAIRNQRTRRFLNALREDLAA